ncbi:MAG: ribbon-helix-helix protein, CopG family [Chromatiales bacterium]|nr:ribbon-helix-helix protein, CopG family [Chromatiales bacterium]
MKNITVSVDDETYRQARILAAQRGTSVSAMVRAYLEQLRQSATPEADRAAPLFAALDKAGEFVAARRMTREQAHER